MIDRRFKGPPATPLDDLCAQFGLLVFDHLLLPSSFGAAWDGDELCGQALETTSLAIGSKKLRGSALKVE